MASAYGNILTIFEPSRARLEQAAGILRDRGLQFARVENVFVVQLPASIDAPDLFAAVEAALRDAQLKFLYFHMEVGRGARVAMAGPSAGTAGKIRHFWTPDA